MIVEAVLSLLHGVRSTGPGRWIAKCPSHDDRSPSLSIRELDDGRVLIHDFGGCEVGDVLAALSLTMADLFEKPLGGPFVASKSRIPAADVLATIDHEAHIVALIGADIKEHRAIDGPTWERLAVAVARIGEARASAAPVRIRP
jgi:hypothetical protein